MKKKTSTHQSRGLEVDPQTLSFVKSLCSRLIEALEQIDQLCLQESTPKPEPSSLGPLQGIGLFSYVKAHQQQLKKNFPAFTEDQILSIIIARWQNLSNNQKKSFCQKINILKFSNSKKIRKLSKQSQKYFQNIFKEPQQRSQSIHSKQIIIDKTMINTQIEKSKNEKTQKQQKIDQIIDLPTKHSPNPISQIQQTKNTRVRTFQIKTQINTIVSSNLIQRQSQNTQHQEKSNQHQILQNQQNNPEVQEQNIIDQVQEAKNSVQGIVVQQQKSLEDPSSIIPETPISSAESFSLKIDQNNNSEGKYEWACAEEIQQAGSLQVMQDQQEQITFGKIDDKIEQKIIQQACQQSKISIVDKIQAAQQTPMFKNCQAIQENIKNQALLQQSQIKQLQNL